MMTQPTTEVLKDAVSVTLHCTRCYGITEGVQVEHVRQTTAADGKVMWNFGKVMCPKCGYVGRQANL
jgi:hypothetical protein